MLSRCGERLRGCCRRQRNHAVDSRQKLPVGSIRDKFLPAAEGRKLHREDGAMK
jgi:hypothetical protein